MIKQMLPCCGGDHEPDTPDTWVKYDGWTFKPPFKCMCCGKDICARQFAWGRCCGVCDMGGCDPANRAYQLNWAHEHPAWWSSFGVGREESIAKFAELSGITAERSPTQGEEA